MAEEPEKQYRLETSGGLLRFTTLSYSTEDKSVLNAGIYGRELQSSLVSGGASLVLAVLIYALKIMPGTVLAILSAVVFTVIFVALRMYVFKASGLLLDIDKATGGVSVATAGFRGMRRSFKLSDLSGICKGLTVVAPKNLDGARFIEKIAVQHGQVLSGFSDVHEYHTVNLELNDATSIMVFSTTVPYEANDVLSALRKFTGIECP